MYRKLRRKYSLKLMKIEYFVCILFIGAFIYYLPKPNELHSFCVIPYFLTYELGFISRGLMGSILGFFFPYLSIKTLWYIIGILLVGLIILTCYYCKRITEVTAEEHKNSMFFLIFVFCVNPASIAFLFYWGNYGRMDMYMISILLCSSLLIVKNNKLFLVPILCVIGLLIHQGFMFSYFPAILLLLFYASVIRKDIKTKVALGLTLSIACVLFLYLQFLGKINNFSYEQVLEFVAQRTDYIGLSNETMIKLEYFTPIFSFIPMYVIPALKKNIIKIIITLILIAPLIYIFFVIWKSFICDKKKKIWIFYPCFIIFATVPKFVLTVDYGRDLASIIISFFVLIFSLYMMEDLGVKKSFTKIGQRINEQPLVYITMLLWFSCLGKFEAANILEISQNVLDFLYLVF